MPRLAAGPRPTSQTQPMAEIIMSIMSNALAAPSGAARRSWASQLGATLQRWLVAYMTWRLEREAIAQLGSLSDRTLKDMGLTRSEIARVVRGDEERMPRDRRRRRDSIKSYATQPEGGRP